MPLADRLIHTLAIERPIHVLGIDDLYEYDEFNQPVREFVSVTEEVNGFVYPKTSREVPATNQAGAIVGLFTAIFFPSTEIGGADRFHEVDSGDTYQVVGLRPHDFGSSPLLAVDCDLISSGDTPLEEPGS